MADDIKEVKKDIWHVKQDIEKAEKERAGWVEQVSNTSLTPFNTSNPDND